MFIRLYTYISSYMCGNTELFSKNKRQKSLECVKNIISLHQLSWKQSFYLKERLIPIEDLKRSPVKAVAFFLPYISEFCDNRGTKESGILWFSQQKHMEICDFRVVFLWNFVIKYYARRQVLYLPLLPDLPAQAVCEERKAIKKSLQQRR